MSRTLYGVFLLNMCLFIDIYVKLKQFQFNTLTVNFTLYVKQTFLPIIIKMLNLTSISNF